MDFDTTRRKGAILHILKSLVNQSTDILVGTQMVAKGHDFPNITLVGIICADLSLSFPDFRAGERTFQLLAQVAGRAGRGRIPGKVILQTYNPDHYSIITSKDQDFPAFYNKEIGFRRALGYPPFSRMIQISISGKQEKGTRDTAHRLGDASKSLKNSDTSFSKFIDILGPVEAPLRKIANHYRWHILIKGYDVKSLHRFTHQLLAGKRRLTGKKDIFIAVDVDPLFMM
jgi:primosomal protein N' (replication factor Y)